MLLKVDTLPRPKQKSARRQESSTAPARTPMSIRSSGLYSRCKPWLGGFIALILLVLSAPIVVCAAVLVKLTSHGPAFYSQTRVGRKGTFFTMYKIRTMVNRCEEQSGACWSTPGDSRITGVGRWLRHTHVDEFPQLWNVLRGEMSLIGPRPERPEFVRLLEKALPGYADRLLVRPGMTGFAQVQLPADSDMDSVRRKLTYDLYYVAHVGLWLDARVFLATGLKMLGMSFPRLRVLFGFAREETVTQAYENRFAGAREASVA